VPFPDTKTPVSHQRLEVFLGGVDDKPSGQISAQPRFCLTSVNWLMSKETTNLARSTRKASITLFHIQLGAPMSPLDCAYLEFKPSYAIME